MPVYLCKPGWTAQEPWRHGVQVYAYPFPIEDDEVPPHSNTNTNHFLENESIHSNPTNSVNHNIPHASLSMRRSSSRGSNHTLHTISSHTSTNTAPPMGHPIRRVRHAEVVLVDEVSIWYGRYWLRLRWPGSQGGFAGYIALGTVVESSKTHSLLNANHKGASIREYVGDVCRVVPDGKNNNVARSLPVLTSPAKGQKEASNTDNAAVAFAAPGVTLIEDQTDNDQDHDELEEVMDDTETNQEVDDSGPSLPLPPRCESTGLYYPSSSAMELLYNYEDGLSGTSSLSDRTSGNNSSVGQGLIMSLAAGSDAGEPVFCRICREGLHDINYDLGIASSSNTNLLPQPNLQSNVHNNDNTRNPASPASPSRLQTHRNSNNNETNNNDDDKYDPTTVHIQQSHFPRIDPNASTQEKRRILLQQATIPHQTAENPLLAPCTCSGSMAFVHYLCIEQWRCRSRHPAAQNGLNCETCGSAYTLPPPPVRPIDIMYNYNNPNNLHNPNGAFFNAAADDDWLDAMPAHVLDALRRPHFWWQIGAAVVRKKWLRPIAPVVISPIVALYCRARRMLKKRGVSRRRWACSLCRRRARWKCVRCLRSYYCSRQCQNVSWHIVHKHVCYKPARLGWSALLYGGGLAVIVPGTWRDPLIYLTGLALIPLNFYQIGIVAGSIATFTKKLCKLDVRGRYLEFSVVLTTIFMSILSWGLVNGFFGYTNKCTGWTSKLHIIHQYNDYDSGIQNMTLRIIHSKLFGTIHLLCKCLDKFVLSFFPSFVQSAICSDYAGDNSFSDTSFCFETIHNANPNFLWDEKKCASDLLTLTLIYILANSIIFFGLIFKKRNGNRRGRGAAEVGADAGGGVGEDAGGHHGVNGRLRRNAIAMNNGLQRVHQD